MEIFDLSGKTAIVTGGNQGIGFAIARGLAMAGATVVIANRRAPEGQRAAESLRSEGLSAVAIPTDVSLKSSVAELVSKTIDDFGKIDILVTSAGVIVRKPAEEISEEEWDYIMDINLKGVFFCCQLVGRHMIQRKKGKIINISLPPLTKSTLRSTPKIYRRGSAAFLWEGWVTPRTMWALLYSLPQMRPIS